MIEGYLQLASVHQAPDKAEKWVISSNIENLRILRTKEEAGIEVEEGIKQTIIDHLPYAEPLLKEKRKKNIRQTGCSPEYRDYDSPLVRHISKLKKEIPNKDEMFDFYDEFSKWQHWNISGFNTFIELSDKKISLNENDTNYSLVLKWGIFCLLLTAELFNNILHLEREDAISNLLNKLISDY